MKKVYLLLASMAIVGTSFAQNVPAKRTQTASNEDQSSIRILENLTTSKKVAKALPSNLNIRTANKGVTTDTITSHFTGTTALYTATTGGYVAGHNGYGDIGKMQKFDASFGINSTGTISELLLGFGAVTGSPTSVVSVKIWGDNAGKPGTELASVDVPYSDLQTTGLTSVVFANPVTIPANKVFYAGITFTYSGLDTVGLISTSDGDFIKSVTHTWEQWGDLTYHSFGDPTNWGLDVALAIFPVVTLDDVPPPPPTGTVFHYEDFSGGIPSEYAVFDEDGNAVASNLSGIFTDAWVARIAAGSADTSVLSTSWYTPAGTSDDWIITGAITIPSGASDLFLSWEGEAIDPAYPDGYEVYISTTTQSVAGCLANTAVFTIPAEDSLITPRNIDISSYIGQTIYVGFRNNSTDMFILSIDDVKVYSTTTVGLNDKKALDASINVFPNPSKDGMFNVAINSNQLDSYSVTISDVMGREINKYNNLTNGKYNVDLSSESNGVYFIKVQSGDSISTQKIVLNK